MEHGNLCVTCWDAIQFTTQPFCTVCGQPFEYTGMVVGGICGHCLALPPAFTQCRSVCIYNEASRPLVTRFKYGDRLVVAPMLARWMVRAGKTMLEKTDIIVPVPLHRRRLFQRRFNQAALLGHEIHRLTGIPMVADLMKRRKNTPPQASISTRPARLKNVVGAFTLNTRYAAYVRGKNIVLIDDIRTTGATVNNCAKLLLRAGAEKVFVLTFGQTLSR